MRIRKPSVTIAVGTHERALGISQEAGSRRRSFIVGLRCSIVADVARTVSERGIKADVEAGSQRDVRIESDVQTVHVVILQGALLRNIAHGEVVVSHSITALDVDTIVLGHGSVVDQVLPVSVLMVLFVIVVRRILVEELERAVGGIGGLQQLRSIAAILVGIHHREVLGL